MEHFLSTTDWSHDRLDRVLKKAADIKAGKCRERLDGRVMGMVFFNPSLRTRTSFEVGMYQLGGHAVNLSVGGGMWDLEAREGVVMDGSAAEHVKEAVPVLGRYADILGVRAFPCGTDWQEDRKDPIVTAFAKASEVPVISMESALWHPCQALADAMTWDEQGLQAGDRVVLTWSYHPKPLPAAVPHSVVAVAAQRGLDVTVLRPNGYDLDSEIIASATAIAGTTGGAVNITDDLVALDGAKVVYAKSWGSLKAYGDPKKEAALREPHRGWQVTRKWMDRTNDGRFMHCLPVRRNVVVADEVLDSAASAVVDQAENRLHAQKAMLLEMLGGRD